MPKIAILSDIHANLPAFKAVLKEVLASGAEHIAVLGDIVGYGASPSECVDLCQKLRVSAVIGNHDLEMRQYLNGRRPKEPNWKKSDFLSGLVHAADSLSSDQIEWLAALPYAKLIKGAVIAHASLDNPECFHYINSYEHAVPTLKLLTEQKYQVGFFGHTHEQEVFSHPKTQLSWENETTFTIPAGHPCVVMVGSVGQPRDEDDRRASWVLWDSDSRRVELRKTEFNRIKAAQDIARAGLPIDSAFRLISPEEFNFLTQ